VPGDDPEVTDENCTEGVRKNFSDRIIVAKDLMELALPSSRPPLCDALLLAAIPFLRFVATAVAALALPMQAR
jgi:hypothetical protein